MKLPKSLKFIINGIANVKVDPPYLYKVLTWGGFYNEEHVKHHKQVEGVRYFGSAEERNTYIKDLRQIAKNNKASVLAFAFTQGFEPYIRQDIILHRVTESEGVRYYTKYEVSNCHSWSWNDANYHMANKWYPGHNDYPMGDDFDYGRDDWIVVSEWIEGSFNRDEE